MGRYWVVLILLAAPAIAQIFHGSPGLTRKPDHTIADAAPGPVTSVGFANNGDVVVARDAGNAMTAWDLKTGKQFGAATASFQLAPKSPGVIVSATSPDGVQRAAADGNRIKIWDIKTGELLPTLEGHAGEVLSIAYSPNGRTLASGGADRSLRLWTIPLPPIPPEDLKKIEAAIPAKATVRPKKPRRLLVFWRADAIQRSEERR